MGEIMNLPKLYAPVYIKFSSLRACLGANLGVIDDVDTDVIRKCRRVLKPSGGWKWQLVDYYRLIDNYLEIDKQILDDCGSFLVFREVMKNETQI